MSESTFSISEFFTAFLFLSAFSVVPIALLSFIINAVSSKNPSPYTITAVAKLCIPGLLYGFLESVSAHQGLNFISVIAILSLSGIVSLFLIRRINLNFYLALGCFIAILMWLVVPKATMKLF